MGMRRPFYLFLLLASAYSWAETSKTETLQCDDEAKLKAFIRKGAMTKEFCLKLQGDKINLFVTGDFFKLGSDHNHLVPKGEIAADISVKTTKTTTQAAPTESINVTKAKTASEVFARITNKLLDKIKDLNKTSKVNGLNLKAVGYADGVRNLDPNYDANIQEDYFKQETKQLPTEDGEYLIFSKKEFQNAANEPKNRKSELDKTPKVPDEFIKILDPVRNMYLAERRAQSLLKIIFGGKFDQAVIDGAEITGFHSPTLATGKSLCKGYCTYRRGAKLTMTIPDLSKLNTAKPVVHPIPAPLVSLNQYHYLRFNQLNLYNHLYEINSYLNKSNHPYKHELKNIVAKRANSWEINLMRNAEKKPLEKITKPIPGIKVELPKRPTECSNTVYTENFEINCKEVLLRKRYSLTDEGKKYLKEQNRDKNAETEKLQNIEIDFFKQFLKESTGMDIGPENVYLHWARVMFWSTLGYIDFDESDRLIFIPNTVRTNAFNSRKIMKVTLSPQSMGNILVREVLENCEQLVPKGKSSGCEGLREYISDFETGVKTEQDKLKTKEEVQKSSRKRFLSVSSIFSSVANGNQNEMSKLAVGSIYMDYFDLMEEENKNLDDIKPSANVVVTARAIDKELVALKKDPQLGDYFNAVKNSPALIQTSNDNQNLRQSIVRTSLRGGTTSTFNAINTRLGSLWALKHFPKYYSDKILKPIQGHEGISDIYLNIDRVSSFDTDNSKNEIKGFFHNACKSGVLFEIDKKATKFIYLSRLDVREDYKKYTDDNKIYDEFYSSATEVLETEKKAPIIPPFVMVKTKHPSTYVIPQCSGCKCVHEFIERYPKDNLTKPTDFSKELETKKESIFKIAQDFENFLITTAYRLDFHSDFTYITNPVKNKAAHTKLAIKGTWRATVPYKSHNAKNILEGLGLTGESLDSTYCLYSPVIPQAHSVGDGKTDEAAAPTEVPKEIPENNCALLEFLDSTKDEKGKLLFPDLLTKPEEVDPIAVYCAQISTHLGDLTKCEEPGQLCLGLSNETTAAYSKECNQTTSQINTTSTMKNVDFCTKVLIPIK